MTARAPAVMLVAGEASGDLHGAALCKALLTLAPGWRLFGMGGARMAAAGMDLLVDVTPAAVSSCSSISPSSTCASRGRRAGRACPWCTSSRHRSGRGAGAA
ncbi:MAG: hypothetical protein HYU25_14465 [Candidatus Rokubacteria bacterium]|nr:hypothetical protein [Candidatus Rokubacteria bacterium]